MRNESLNPNFSLTLSYTPPPPTEPSMETSEFQVLSLDGKVWSFEASSPEVRIVHVYSLSVQL